MNSDGEERFSQQLGKGSGQSSPDLELLVINDLITSLSQLTPEARSRVVAYVFGRLGILQESQRVEPNSPPENRHLPSLHNASSMLDIRSFAAEKQPVTAIERTAVVAFFLSELAPDRERKSSIGQDEVTRYFKQAGFPLPSSPSMALVHSKNAGFFEAEGPGQYRLNAVGYNLVAHRMPKETSSVTRLRRPSASTRSKKKLGGKVSNSPKALPAPKTESLKKR